VRRSNTEPIVRVVVESLNEEWVSRAVNKLQNV
jgi:phosphomannomutase